MILVITALSFVCVAALLVIIHGLEEQAAKASRGVAVHLHPLAVALFCGFSLLVAGVCLGCAWRNCRNARSGRGDARFLAAVNQLGHESPTVRVAGAREIARLADQYPDLRQQCVDTLCSQLRQSTADGPQRAGAVQPVPSGEVEVRTAIVGMIREHLQPTARSPWWSCRFDMVGARIEDADLDGIRLKGGCLDFTGALFPQGRMSLGRVELDDSELCFDGARFTGGEIAIHNSMLRGSRISFNHAQFSAGLVSLSQSHLCGGLVIVGRAVVDGGELRFDRSMIDDTTVSLNRVSLVKGTVSFVACEYSDRQVYFSDCEFSGGAVSILPSGHPYVELRPGETLAGIREAGPFVLRTGCELEEFATRLPGVTVVTMSTPDGGRESSVPDEPLHGRGAAG